MSQLARIVAAAGRRRRRGPVRWSADFALLAAGANATLPGGLALTRASAATVQTGDATLVTSGIANDVARGGRRQSADPLALVLEEARTNLVGAGRNPGGSGWTAASGVVTTGFANGPDGSVNSAWRSQVASGAFGTYNLVAVTGGQTHVGSCWKRSVSGSVTMQTTLGGASVNAVVDSLTTSWQRRAVAHVEASASWTMLPTDGHDWSAQGGVAAGARDEVVDCVQTELGLYATEYIHTTAGSAARSGERLYHPSGAALLAGGQLRLEVALQPKGARADYPAVVYLWFVDASNYARIDPTTGVLTVAIGGATNTTSALTWAAADLLELWVAAGGGAATVVKFRVNGGAVTTCTITGSALGALAVPGALDLLCSGTGNQFTAWVRALRAYRAAATPGWAV